MGLQGRDFWWSGQCCFYSPIANNYSTRLWHPASLRLRCAGRNELKTGWFHSLVSIIGLRRERYLYINSKWYLYNSSHLCSLPLPPVTWSHSRPSCLAPLFFPVSPCSLPTLVLLLVPSLCFSLTLLSSPLIYKQAFLSFQSSTCQFHLTPPHSLQGKAQRSDTRTAHACLRHVQPGSLLSLSFTLCSVCTTFLPSICHFILSLSLSRSHAIYWRGCCEWLALVNTNGCLFFS